ncbi:MAG: hypothetical protein AAGA08_11715 [Pseudomonadota bacterium]
MTYFIKTATCAVALTLGSGAFAVTPIKSVDVDVDLEAIQNAEAATFWTDIAEDIETEIATRIVSQIEEDGAALSIDIDELSLANTFQTTFGSAENYLVGDVLISNPLKTTDHQFYTLKVSFEQARAYLPENVDFNELTSDSPYYYDSMVDAFADNVVSKLK